jgi:hypothetical protein
MTCAAERTSAARAPDVEEARDRACWSWRTLIAFVVTCALARFAYLDVIA